MNVIPLPNQFQRHEGHFVIDQSARLSAGSELEPGAALLSGLVEKACGLPLARGEGNIRFVKDTAVPEEAYRIDCVPDRLTVFAGSGSGAFYAVQTLRQLFDLDIPGGERPLSCECVAIEDAPRYRWRGFMLDNARSFFGKEDILRLIELVAMQKYNIFHLHLTDDQGWRVQIDRYPRLNEVGSWRGGTIHRKGGQKVNDGIRHGGFLTKDDLREIVSFAAARHVTVVPEVDMPGHATAMIAAYPELCCTGSQIPVAQGAGIYPDILCAGNPEVYEMLENILSELIGIFPSPFFHIGGDEAPKKRWKACPKCQQVIREQGLRDENALQAYFVNHFVDFLKRHGKRVVGWSECINPKLDDGVILQHWKPHSDRAAVGQINRGRETIISKFFYVYTDYPYAMMPLEKTYCFNPTLRGVLPANERYVLGVETPVWTEYIHTREKLDYQIFPRVAAVSEVAWTQPDRKDYGAFLGRLAHYYQVYDAMGVRFAKKRERPLGKLKRYQVVRRCLRDEDYEYNMK